MILGRHRLAKNPLCGQPSIQRYLLIQKEFSQGFEYNQIVGDMGNHFLPILILG